jgi:hypothetical protein
MPGNSGEDEGSGDSGMMPSSGPSKDAVKKLDQIIQVQEYVLVLTSSTISSLFFLHRISIQKLQSLYYLRECPYPYCQQKMGLKRSINGYVFIFFLQMRIIIVYI